MCKGLTKERTNDCGVTVINHKKNLPVSKLTTTTQVDTDINNDGDTQYFATPYTCVRHLT